MSHWSEQYRTGYKFEAGTLSKEKLRRDAYANYHFGRKRCEKQENNDEEPDLRLVGTESSQSRLRKREKPTSMGVIDAEKKWSVPNEEELSAFTLPNERIGEPIATTGDPRWILAVRTSQAMQGSIVRPEDREKLIGLGKSLGLSAFDCNLIIAILQDQARRGFLPEYCPQLSHKQLQLIPLPRPNPLNEPIVLNWKLKSAMICGIMLAFEALILWVYFR